MEFIINEKGTLEAAKDQPFDLDRFDVDLAYGDSVIESGMFLLRFDYDSEA